MDEAERISLRILDVDTRIIREEVAMENEKMDVPAVVLRRLSSDMKKRAEELHDIEGQLYEWARQDKYVRICGESFRPVSLAPESPLVSYGKSSIKTLKNVRSRFSQDTNAEVKEVEGNKEERRLQAYIIRTAMKSQRNLIKVLGLQDHFDELRFCLDEISLGDSKNHVYLSADKKDGIVRCDLLAVGKRKGEADWRPALIELKYARELTRLDCQLQNFTALFKGNAEMTEALEKLIRAIVPEVDRYSPDFVKAIVWPASNGAKNLKSLPDGVLEVVYKRDLGQNVSLDKWSLKPCRGFDG